MTMGTVCINIQYQNSIAVQSNLIVMPFEFHIKKFF